MKTNPAFLSCFDSFLRAFLIREKNENLHNEYFMERSLSLEFSFRSSRGGTAPRGPGGQRKDRVDAFHRRHFSDNIGVKQQDLH
jgi:hypothetical protein